MVSQSSGFNWTNANLTLSTAVPSRIDGILPLPGYNRRGSVDSELFSEEDDDSFLYFDDDDEEEKEEDGADKKPPEPKPAATDKNDDNYWTFNEADFLGQTKGLEVNRATVKVNSAKTRSKSIQNKVAADVPEVSMLAMDVQSTVSSSIFITAGGGNAKRGFINAQSESLGSLQISTEYNIQHLVNVTHDNTHSPRTQHLLTRQNAGYQHMLLIDRKQLSVISFVYSMTSQLDCSGNTMKSKTDHSRTVPAHHALYLRYPTAATPLLPADMQHNNLYVYGSFVGNINFPGARAGEKLLVNVGDSEHLKVTTQARISSSSSSSSSHRRLSTQHGLESLWESVLHQVDQRKYLALSREKVITVQSMQTTQEATEQTSEYTLVVVAEQIPAFEEIDNKYQQKLRSSSMAAGERKIVTVELLSPSLKQLETLPSGLIVTGDDFLHHVVDQEVQRVSAVNDQQADVSAWRRARHYRCPLTHTLYTAVWLQPNEKQSISLQYRVLLPGDNSRRDFHATDHAFHAHTQGLMREIDNFYTHCDGDS